MAETHGGNLVVADEVDEATVKIIGDGLDAYNEVHNGPNPTKSLWVVYRDDQGHVSGGLHAFTMWDWCVISMLWVNESNRGQGIGSRLLAKGEEAARMRGCTRFQLATMTFQAPRFYERHGYAEIGRVPDYPPGHSYIWMTKIVPP